MRPGLGLDGFTNSARYGLLPSIVVQDCAEAAVLGELCIATEFEQVEVERLVGLLLAVALDFDGDGLRRLAGGEGQRAGLGALVAFAVVALPFTVANDVVTACS